MITQKTLSQETRRYEFAGQTEAVKHLHVPGINGNGNGDENTPLLMSFRRKFLVQHFTDKTRTLKFCLVGRVLM
jgi:hypothetical protein